jgi:3-dehydroquinate synthetase
MTRDKKVRRGAVRFVLLERIGAPVVREVASEDCNRALSAAVA